MTTGELLLELLSEEIPARMQRRAIDDLTGLIRDKLAAAELAAKNLRGYVTPRRLTVIADGIPARQPDMREERRGPRLGAPAQAVEGFLRAAGLDRIEQCEVRDTGRGEFYFAAIERPGRAAATVLSEIVHAAIAELPWPKSMRFPAANFRWVRPLTSVICLFGGEVVSLQLGQVPVGRTTRGHRFLSPAEFEVADAADYLRQLEQAHVVLDQDRRREIIETGLKKLANDAGLQVKPDPDLLGEVTGLVEYPVPLIGTIDEDNMTLPPEVLATAMRTHQKYFTCLYPDGTTAPRFLFVANNKTPDDGATVVAGNERVLKARLADARFFWDQDRKSRLEDRIEALKDRVLNDKLTPRLISTRLLGASSPLLKRNAPDEDWPWYSMRMKAWRIAILSTFLAENMLATYLSYRGIEPGTGATDAAWAGELAKADLSTGMVGEFPELQGVIGRYYALQDGWDSRVANAIAEHYNPLGPNDICPTAPISVIVALADKVDTLVTFFALGERPTGSRDPFALRRAALGVIRIILENNLRLSLSKMFEEAYSRVELSQAVRTLLGERYPGDPPGPNLTDPEQDLLVFVADRLKVHLREQGVRHDLIAAVFALAEDDLVRLLARVDALAKFLGTDDGSNLLIAYRRASNIVRIEEQRDGQNYTGDTVGNLLKQPEEHTLSERLNAVGDRVTDQLSQEFFESAMIALSQLRRPVDEFFDKVTVNADDPELRANRLRLLSRIRATMNQVADFSQIEG